MKKRKTATRPSKKKNLGRFKSGIEKYCADQLKSAKIDFDYEEVVYELMPSFRYPNRYLKMTAKSKVLSDRSNSIQQPIRYTPDFVAKDMSWVIETKGYVPSHHDFPMRWKLFLKHLVNNNIDCAVYIAKNKQQVDDVIQDIKRNESK
jgi:hypothetical protein|tara:strand:+ start:22178 stop:22621 length:444 start_codon:yes stop_codon:yes gene_type:complete